MTRTAAQRRAAALVEMATRSASTPQGSRRPAPLFTVVLGDDSFAHLCELTTGTIIAPGQLVPHLDSALLETVLFADPLTAVGVSPQRTFNGRLRRAVEVRQRHCEHPSGCDEPMSRCDVDHITPHSHGGITSQFNGRLECRPTTATTPSTTTTPNHTPNATSQTWTSSARSCAGDSNTNTPTNGPGSRATRPTNPTPPERRPVALATNTTASTTSASTLRSCQVR